MAVAVTAKDSHLFIIATTLGPVVLVLCKVAQIKQPAVLNSQKMLFPWRTLGTG